MRRTFKFGLTARLVLLTVCAVLPALAILTYNEYDLRRAREQDMRQRVVQITGQFGEEMGELREGARQLLIAMARLPGILSLDGGKCELLLVSLRQSYPNYASLSVTGTDGQTICSSSRNTPVFVGDLPFFKRAMAQDGLVVGDYWKNPVSGAKVIDFAMKFAGPEGNPAGVVSVALDLKWLTDHLANRGLPLSASVLIADREGNIITRLPRPDGLIGTNIRKTHEAIMDGDETGTEESKGVDGVTRVFGYVPPALPPYDLFLSAGLAKNEAFADIDRATRRGISLILWGLLVATSAALLGVRYFVRNPIAELTCATADWRDGKYDTRARPQDPTSELGQLAVAFNEMADAVESRQKAQKRAEQDLLELTNTLEERVEKRTEELALANRVKSQFLANMSHEIRTPMNGVLGMLELLLEGELSARQRRFAQTAFRSGESLLHIVNGILDLSKIEAGKLQLSPEPFNLPTMIEEAVELFSGAARAKHVNLAHMISQEVPPSVIGDEGRIRQVLTNILGNAVKFTTSGEVVLYVNVAGRDGLPENDEDQIRLEFKVRDTGIGIPRDKQAEIFDVFSQADETTTRRYGGTGLGLSIARQLCELMGGSISVESVPGVGSEFRFFVTVRKVTGEKCGPAAAGWPLLKGRSAVVVDDNVTNLEILQNHLTRVGVRTRLVTNAGAALGVLQESADGGTRFDFILIDNNLPGTSGCELARQIQADKSLAGIRIIILSSSEDMSDTTPSEHESWLIKPVRRTELYECLATTASSPSRAKPVAPPVSRSAPGRSRGRVLLVEDNEVNLEVSRSILLREGCQVVTATDGNRALEAFEKERFDAIFMDCHMPEMDGFEATAAIRAREEGSRRHTPIIALTANAIAGDRERCLRGGMDDYVSKPVSRQAIQIMLERWCADAHPAEPDPGQATAGPSSGQGDVEPGVEGLGVEELGVEQWDVEAPGFEEAGDAELCEQALDVLRSLEDDEHPGILRKIMATFLVSTPDLLDALTRAAEEGDITRLRNASHTLKSSSASVGAMALSERCARLEMLAREGDTGDASALVEAIVTQFTRIRPAVERHTRAPAEYAAE